jgi:asparagine synthase (glutamine-hydrolysing)
MKNWLRRDLQGLMRGLLSRERTERRGWFVSGAVSDLVEAHVDGRENHAHTLFSLMVLERWATAHLDGRG